MKKEIFQMQGNCLRILLPTEVDHGEADYIREETDCLMARHYVKQIVFDFGATTFMDSSGIGMLMGRYRAMGMQSGSIRAVNVGERIYKILQLSGVYRYITISRVEESEKREEVRGRV